MYEVTSIKELESNTLKLVHPVTGELLGAKLLLAGSTHPKRKACEYNRDRTLRAKIAKRGRLELTDPQDDADYDIDHLVACTLGWEGLARNGKPLDFTPEEVRTIYASSEWMRDQANAFLKESSNFLEIIGTA